MKVKEQGEIILAYERGEEIEWRPKQDDDHVVKVDDEWSSLPIKDGHCYKMDSAYFNEFGGDEHQFDFNHYEYRKKKMWWRAEKRGGYFYIDERLTIRVSYDNRTEVDDILYRSGNYFSSTELAETARNLFIKTIKKIHEDE